MADEQSKAEQRQKLLAMALEASALAPAPATQELGSKIRHGITATLVAGALSAGAAHGAGAEAPSAAPALEGAGLQTGAGQMHRFGDGWSPDGCLVVFTAGGDKADKTLFKSPGDAGHQAPDSAAGHTSGAGQGAGKTTRSSASADLFRAIAEMEELTLIPPAGQAAKPNAAQQRFAQEMEREVDRITANASKLPKLRAALGRLGGVTDKLVSFTKAIGRGGGTAKDAATNDERSIESAARATLKTSSKAGSSTGMVPTRGTKAAVRGQATAQASTESVAQAPKTPSRPIAPGGGIGM